MCKDCRLFKKKKCDGLFGGCEFYQADEEKKKKEVDLSLIAQIATFLVCLGILIFK